MVLEKKDSSKQPVRYMPSKEEVKHIKSHLTGVVKAVKDSDKPIENSAESIYDTDKKVVLSSIFKRPKTVGPKGGAIDIGEDLLDSPFND